jgi:DNA-binding transcriptional LysR family regulator
MTRRCGPVGAAGARVAPFLVSTDIHLLRLCAAEGMGIAFLPDAGFPEPAGIRDSLVPVLPDEVGRERSIRVVVPAVLSEIPRIRAVLAEIRSVLRPPR